jgi:hypothetical protein
VSGDYCGHIAGGRMKAMTDRPYETARDAHAAAAAAFPPEAGSVLTAEQNCELLHRALQAAGVTTGAFEDGIARWLGNFEDSSVAVIARWITAAAQPPEGTVTEWTVRIDSGELGCCNERTARYLAADFRADGTPATVECRQVTPWTEAPEPEEDEEHG